MSTTTPPPIRVADLLPAARKALAEARGVVRPIDAETRARMVELAGAVVVAAADAEVEAIAATIPALEQRVAELEELACTRCSGSGDYNAPTRHMRQGRPTCFACGGSGTRRS